MFSFLSLFMDGLAGDLDGFIKNYNNTKNKTITWSISNVSIAAPVVNFKVPRLILQWGILRE